MIVYICNVLSYTLPGPNTPSPLETRTAILNMNFKLIVSTTEPSKFISKGRW